MIRIQHDLVWVARWWIELVLLNRSEVRNQQIDGPALSAAVGLREDGVPPSTWAEPPSTWAEPPSTWADPPSTWADPPSTWADPPSTSADSFSTRADSFSTRADALRTRENDSSALPDGARCDPRQPSARRLSLRNNAIRAIRSHLATEEQRARLNAFRGTAETAQKLADGLRGVAQTLEDLRTGAAPEVVSLLDEVGLGTPYVKKLVDTAELLLEADRAAAGAPPQRMVSQRELDLQDGRVLHVIGIFFRAFQAARDIDATILVPPLTKLARLFKGHRAPKGSEPLSPVEGPITD